MEQDRKDLLGLSSGLGDPESDARARRLLQVEPEAREYLRDVEHLAWLSCEATAASHDRLSRPDAEKLAGELCRIAGSQAASETRDRRRLLYPLMGMAAGLILLLIPSVWLLQHREQHLTAIYMSPGAYVREDTSKGVSRGSVTLPTEMDTGDNQVAFMLPSEGVLLAQTYTRFSIRKALEIVLDEGVLFVRAGQPLRIETPSGSIRLDRGSVNLAAGPRNSLSVLEGKAELQVSGGSLELVAGQVGMWDPEASDVTVDSISTEIPEWAVGGLKIARLTR